MKEKALQYLTVLARLPFAVIGGILSTVGAVFNTLSSLALGKLRDADDYLESIR